MSEKFPDETEVGSNLADRTVSDSGKVESDRPVAAFEAELADLKDRFLRSLAEQENIRRRAVREREEAVKFAGSGLAQDLLPTADNLRRAIESVPDEAVSNETVRQLLAGVVATERALLEAFEKHGIRRFDPLREPFDPNRHQAIFEAADVDDPAGTVIQVIQPGYLYHDRLLRPAMVGVAKGRGDPKSAGSDVRTGESPQDGGGV